VIESNYPTDEVIRRNNPEDNRFSGRAYPEDRDVMRSNDGEVMRRNHDDRDVMRRNDGDDFTRGHFPEDRDVIRRNDGDRDVIRMPLNRQLSFVGRNERTGSSKLIYQDTGFG
jgi:hypothetical protein